MNIEQWLDQYRYLAVFLGVFLEGPITLALAGYFAYQGYLNIIMVLLTAFIAAFLYIEIVFFIGMALGQYLINRWPLFQHYYSHISTLVGQFERLFILFFRFIYGAHTLAPLVFGMRRIKWGYFTILNAIGAVIWSLALFLLGYFFGQVFRMLIEDIKHYEKRIALILVMIMLIYYFIRRLVWRRVIADEN